MGCNATLAHKKAYAQQIMDYHFARACVAMSNVKKDTILVEGFFSVCEFRVSFKCMPIPSLHLVGMKDRFI